MDFQHTWSHPHGRHRKMTFTHTLDTPNSCCGLMFYPAPEGQPVKRLKYQIHAAKLEKLNLEEEGSQYTYKWNNPRRASVCRDFRTYLTDSPTRQKSHAFFITPLHHSQKKMAQWRTSSTHDSIHTGLIGRCSHVHLTHQIHGVADVFPRSQRATSQTVEGTNPRRQKKREIIYKSEGRRETKNMNGKIPKGQVYVPRLEHTFDWLPFGSGENVSHTMDLVCQVYVWTSSDDSRVAGNVCWKSVIEPSSFWEWCNGVMDSACDFYLLGESVP